MRPPTQYQLTAGQGELANAHLGYAQSYITKYRNRDTDMDDLYQEASVGLCDAANLFDQQRSVQFVTFATPHLREKCDRFVRHYSHSQILSFDDEDEIDEDNTQRVFITSLSEDDEEDERLTFEEVVPDPDSQEAEERLNNKHLAERLLSILTERERKMVKCAFYIEHASQIRLRIWQRFGLNKSRFYDIVEGAILKMKRYVHENDIESPFSD